MHIKPLYQSFLTQAQIDAEYDASKSVSDPAMQMFHYTEQSALARRTLRCTLDVPYGPTRAETLDIFSPEKSNAPVFVFIHGGYWRSLSSKEFSCVALGLQSLGIAVVVINYALCPEVSIDEITRQARASIAWVLRNAKSFGGDPSRVAAGGHSAGGHLAAMCLQARWDEDYGFSRDPLKGAVLVSGLFDLEPLRYSYLQPQIQLDEGIVRRNSPLFSVRPCATPVLITWGELETSEFARQAKTFHSAWQAVGNTSELTAQTAAHHFSAIHGFEDAASPLCQWIKGVLS
jgi:arylformamidase